VMCSCVVQAQAASASVVEGTREEEEGERTRKQHQEEARPSTLLQGTAGWHGRGACLSACALYALALSIYIYPARCCPQPPTIHGRGNNEIKYYFPPKSPAVCNLQHISFGL
jgi:hypothetical protein